MRAAVPAGGGRVALAVLVLVGVALTPAGAQTAPPAAGGAEPHPWKALLAQALDRESRCRQALGWLGVDCNAYQDGNLHLMQEELDKRKADSDARQHQVDDLQKRLDACMGKDTVSDAATTP